MNQQQQMMKQIQQMQTRMAKMQEDLGSVTVTGTAGGGAITVTANGHQKLLTIAIDPSVMEEGPELLGDMVLAAANAALDESRKAASEQMGALTAGLNLPPGLL